jgi:hypothetical protein
VVGVVVPVPAAGAVAPVEVPSPTRPIPFPPIVTGTDTTGDTCVPEAVPSEPEVVGAAAGAAGVDAADVGVLGAVDTASPPTATALPVAATGAVTAPATCVPEAMPSEPEVVGAAAGAAAGAGAGAGADVAAASPPTEIALPETCTGAATSGTTCVPEAVPSAPDVDGDAAGAEDDGAAAAVAVGRVADDTASPRTPRALPVADTGASIDGATWVPEASPSAPEVVAAFAAAAPPSVRPPTKRANQSPLETYLFMIVAP